MHYEEVADPTIPKRFTHSQKLHKSQGAPFVQVMVVPLSQIQLAFFQRWLLKKTTTTQIALFVTMLSLRSHPALIEDKGNCSKFSIHWNYAKRTCDTLCQTVIHQQTDCCLTLDINSNLVQNFSYRKLEIFPPKMPCINHECFIRMLKCLHCPSFWQCTILLPPSGLEITVSTQPFIL